ncbi:hypothetical protein CEO60_28390 [Klebsiella pneumoniae]|nr:hypothetical protein CEO98_21300 [Klebsiella pneumoniae]OZK43946.1 hypothetical protein CEO80_28340 [Klebsiella pneumoniae]OZL55854.1 hypothetical protein CEO60_28390 [Klebsiella pneumoniae]OZL94873.1 hypothetical protein CEO53_28435 [Klebsiella pneumoniae]
MLAVPFFCRVAANALPDLRPVPLRAEALNAISLLWSSFFGHADQMVGLCTGGQLGGRAGQRFVLCG